MILVDSNVLIDILDRDPDWYDWSVANLRRAAGEAYLFVNPVVVGQVGWQFESYSAFANVLAAFLIGVEPLPPEAAYVASLAFQAHRAQRKSEGRKLPLPDFFIGGHAHVAGATILTRDPRFYRSYFPQVELITPETQP